MSVSPVRRPKRVKRSHAIFSALLDSDSEMDTTEHVRRIWHRPLAMEPRNEPGSSSTAPVGRCQQRDVAPVLVPVPVVASSVPRVCPTCDPTRPLAGEQGDPVEDAWQQYRIRPKRELWPTWGTGICDVRDGRRACEGRMLGYCMSQVAKIMKVECFIKIGLCHSVSNRWLMYMEAPIGEWQPTVMFLVATLDGRSGAGMLEASLILHIEEKYGEASINRVRGDLGGEGPRRSERRHSPHSVYVVARPSEVTNADRHAKNKKTRL